jgi:hypothetical protein
MIISFYEEYPTKENLEKLNLIKFPTKLYLAAHSLKEFKKYKRKIKSRYIEEIAYWPLLTKNEGYWFSAFTKRKALKRTINELKNTKVPIMWDAELPTHPNPLLYLTQLFNFLSNRKLINNFVKNHKKIYVAEYFFINNRLEKLFRFLCLNFPPKNNLFPMRMAYSSLHDFGKTLMEDEIKKGKQEFKDNFILAYGTLATGEESSHKEISFKLLKRDLDLAKKYNVKEVVLYRLGGLNKKYIKILKQYQ